MADINITIEAKVDQAKRDITAFAGEVQGQFAALGTRIEGSTIGIRKFASSLSGVRGVVTGIVGVGASVVGVALGINRVVSGLLTLSERQRDIYQQQNRELGDILDTVEKIAAARRKSEGVAGSSADLVRLDFAAQRRALEAQLAEAEAAQRSAAPTLLTRGLKSAREALGFGDQTALDEEVAALNKAEAIRSALKRLAEEELKAVQNATAEEQKQADALAKAATEREAELQRQAELERKRQEELDRANREAADSIKDQLDLAEARANMQDDLVKKLEREQELKQRISAIDKLAVSEEEKAALRAQAQRIAAAQANQPATVTAPKSVRESFLGFAAGLGGGLTATQALGDPARDERRALAEKLRSEIEKTRAALVEALRRISIPQGAQYATMGP